MLALADSAAAASCGTMAAPTACSLTSGNVVFTASAFQLLVSSFTTQYQVSDILIEILAAGSGNAQLQFSKNPNGPTPGIVFLANPGESAAFSHSYQMDIAPAQPGTVALTGLNGNGTFSAAGNGVSSVQFIVDGMPSSCLATSGNGGSANCALPPGGATSFQAGDIVQLGGNTGNTSIVSYRNVYNTSFTAASSAVPEPGSFAMLGLGIGILAWRRMERK